MIWVCLLPFTLGVLLLSNSVQAKIYSCEGPNGGTMLTDQPKGKRGCTVVQTPSPSPPGGFTPPVEEAPPLQPEFPVTPPAAAPGLVPRQSGLAEHLPSPGRPREAGEKAAPEAQRCSPRVNPLNPFAGINCPPVSGNISEEPKNP